MAGQMSIRIQAAEDIIGYTFQSSFILWEALNVAGSNAVRAGDRVFLDGNKRMALLGDAILKTALIDDWYPTGSPRAVGQGKVASIAANTNLATIGQGSGLNVAINNNPSQAGHISPAMMATTVEAIIGAVYLDSGRLESVKQVMATLRLN